MKLSTLAVAAALLLSTPVLAADEYVIDPSHASASFTVLHLGFSQVSAVISEIEGKVVLDQAAPEKSSVEATMKVAKLNSGWSKRDEHLLTADFLDAAKYPTITFKSTRVEKTGAQTANVTGDLTIKGVTKSVVLKATLNKVGPNPIVKKDAVGLTATTVIKRSDFGVSAYVPNVADELPVTLNIEAWK